jgi:transposase
VPYSLTGQVVEVRLTAATVEIFHRGVRVASHARSYQPYQATTAFEHRPKSHQKHLEWTPSRLIEWARTVGPSTAALFEQILASKPHPEMGYRSCLGILRLAKQYSMARLEAAAHRAVHLRACSYQSVKSMLERQLDRLPVEETPAPRTPLAHDNLRGAGYFDTPEPPTSV